MDGYNDNYVDAMNNDFENCWDCGQFEDEDTEEDSTHEESNQEYFECINDYLDGTMSV
jgi:hypothetical protein